MRQSNGTDLVLLVGLVVIGAIVVALSTLVLLQIGSGSPQPERSWNQVRSSGVLVVGTAAEGPPFAYYDDSLQLTGYDVALATSLASRLGLRAQIVDYTFEGFPAALQTGQIDAAIAAISLSPERATLVDFSSIYYVGSDEVLALASAQPNAIRSAEDFSGKRIGVQRGGIYEAWLADRLPRQSILAYPRVDDALRDLRIQRVDYAMLDLAPAEAAARDASLVAIARGLDEQRYAIAVRRGTPALLDRLNRALDQARADGELDRLARQYLKVEPAQMLPQPTPGPVATPRGGTGATLDCVKAMVVGESLGLADAPGGAPAVVQPGQTFTKGWTLRNTGTCAWNAGYRLAYVQGNVPGARMGGASVPINRNVGAGGSTTVSLDLAAPLVPGTYQSIWQLEDDKGVPFGQRVQLRVSVPAPTTPVVALLSADAPASQPAQLSVDRTRVRSGERVAMTWRADGARLAYFYQLGERWQDNAVAPTGQREFYPQASTTYELRVVRETGVEVRQTRVDVDAAPGAPNIVRFSATPVFVPPNQCVDITWDVRGEVSRVNVLSGTTAIWDGAPTSDTLRDCPAKPGNIDYRLEVTGPGGSARAQKFVDVGQAQSRAPGSEGPTAASFVVSPARVQIGACVSLAWSVPGSSAVRVLRGGLVVQDEAPPQGQTQDCPRSAGAVVYRLEATDATDQIVSREQAVVVTDSAPQAPPVRGNWRVTRLHDGNALADPLSGPALTVQFVDGRRIEGLAGCNSYSASYTSDGAAVALVDVGSSSANCGNPSGLMQQEARFFGTLRSVARYTLSSDTLSLLDGNGQALVELRRAQP